MRCYNPNNASCRKNDVSLFQASNIWDYLVQEQCFLGVYNKSNCNSIYEENLNYLQKEHRSFSFRNQIIAPNIHNKHILADILVRLLIVFGTKQNNLISIEKLAPTLVKTLNTKIKYFQGKNPKSKRTRRANFQHDLNKFRSI